jgi:hypothetical protein
VAKNVFGGSEDHEEGAKNAASRFPLPDENAKEQDQAHLEELAKEQKTSTPHRSRPVHPAIGWVLAAVIAGSVLAYRNSRSTILSKEQAIALIDPSLQAKEATAEEDQRYRDTRHILQSLADSELADAKLLGENALVAKSVMSLDGNDSPTINGLTAILSGNFEPLGDEKPFWGQASNIARAKLTSRIASDLRTGAREDAVLAATTELQLFPLYFRTKGMDTTDILKVSADSDLATSRSDFFATMEGLSASEKQRILNAIKPLPAQSPLLHDALARTFSYTFVPAVLDPARRYDLLAMLAIPHTLPIDEKATMEGANKAYLVVDKNLSSGDYAHRDQAPERQLATLGAELEPLLAGDPYYNQGFLQSVQTRWSLWWHANVTGKYLVYHEIPDLLNFQKTIFIDRTNYEATRLQLALDTYATSHGGQLPAKLDDLVKAKIVPTVPVDPMSGAPFFYDASRKAFWSVGFDGKNDGGLPKTDILFQM